MQLLNVIRPTAAGLMIILSQAAAALPEAFQAQYEVKNGGMSLGYLDATLRYTGDQYQYQKNTKATGLARLVTGIKISERVNGQVSGQQLHPDSYIFHEQRHGKNRIDKVKFNGNNATGSYKGTPYSLSVNGDTLDRASLELALARDLAAKKLLPNYPVVEKGHLKNYQFQILGHETINTPAGAFHTVKVKVARDDNNRETLFWMARELGYIPARIMHREKGDTIDTSIRKYRAIAQPIKTSQTK